MWPDPKSRLAAQLKRCGAEAAGISADGLDLGDDLAKGVEEFKPDAILNLRRVHVFLYEAQISREIYEFTLLGPPTKGSNDLPTWWVAKAVHRPRGAQWDSNRRIRGFQEFVDGVVNQMKADGFFPECPQASPADLPSWGGVVQAAAYVPGTELRAAGSVGIGELGYEIARAKVKAQESEDARIRTFGTVVVVAGGEQQEWSFQQLRGRTRDTAGVAKFAPDLGSYFRAAVVAELGKMGIATTDSRRMLRGEIEEATVDFTGWGIGASLRVRWELVEAGSGKVLYAGVKTATTPDRNRPFSEPEAFDLVLRLNTEALVRDPQFAEAIR